MPLFKERPAGTEVRVPWVRAKLVRKQYGLEFKLHGFWLAALLAVGVAGNLWAHGYRQALVQWDPSPDASVTAYQVYWGVASGSYSNRLVVGMQTNAVIPYLIEGSTYYFAVTALNALGLESDYSNEAVFTVPVPMPGPVPPGVTNAPSPASWPPPPVDPPPGDNLMRWFSPSGPGSGFVAMERLAHGVRLTFTVPPGYAYEVQYNEGMAPGSWVSLTNGIRGTGGTAQCWDGSASGPSTRFYRVIQESRTVPPR
jgi:hypothetical protein